MKNTIANTILNISPSDFGPKVRPEIRLAPVPGGTLVEKQQCVSNPDLDCDPDKMPKGFCLGCADCVR